MHTYAAVLEKLRIDHAFLSLVHNSSNERKHATLLLLFERMGMCFTQDTEHPGNIS